MRNIIDIEPVQFGYQKIVGTGLNSEKNSRQIIKSLTQSLTQIKKALEEKLQEP